MFDLANADIAQLESIYEELTKKIENPFEICKMNIQLDISDFFDWIDKRLGRDQTAFANRRAGFLRSVETRFDELNHELQKRINLSRSRAKNPPSSQPLSRSKYERKRGNTAQDDNGKS